MMNARKKECERERNNNRQEDGAYCLLYFLSFRGIFVTFWQTVSSEHILLKTFFLRIFWQLGVLWSIFYKISRRKWERKKSERK